MAKIRDPLRKQHLKIPVIAAAIILCSKTLLSQVPVPGSPALKIVFDTGGLARSAVLPLKLVSFSGKLINSDEAQLRWEVSGETNVARYEIEWSNDSKNWQRIGTVAVADSSGINNYSLTNSQPSLINFYRLKIVEIDGKNTLSAVIRVSGSDRAVVIYPNPAKNSVIISSFNDKPATVIILGNSGKVWLRKTISEPVAKIDISNLPPGNYVVRIIRDNKAAVYKLIKE